MRRLALVLACCFPLGVAQAVPLAAAAPAVQRYSASMFGNPAGSEVCRQVSAAERACVYEYNDRGRGPQLHQVLTLGADGVPVALSVTGNDYFKVPVEETFTRAAGRAAWTALWMT